MRITLLLAATLSAGCQAWSAVPPILDTQGRVEEPARQDTLPPISPRTPESDRAALHLSGLLTVPEDLSRIIATDLKAIRSHYAKDYPFVLDSFIAPWEPGTVMLLGREHTSSQPVDSVEAWGPAAWARLPEQLRPVDIEVLNHLQMLYVQVDSTLHPARVADAYEEVLPAGYSAEPGGVVFVATSGHPIGIGREGRYRLYAFRPSYLIETQLILVRVDQAGEIELVGSGTRGTDASWVETARSLF